jgi:hypothetical protein
MTTTPKKKSQCQRLLAYLRKNRRGITTMEAFANLGICRLSERIRELEQSIHCTEKTQTLYQVIIDRKPERTESGSIVTRYKLVR